jgi:transposase-like protein/IS1 family transposase
MSSIRTKACANPECDNFDKCGQNIGGHGWFATKTGRKRRYRCKICGTTASTNTGTPYAGLRCTRTEFDQVARMTVEGVGISTTARIAGRSRSTIVRWRERAAKSAKNFNDKTLRKFEITELQADELCTFVGGKENAVWIFALIVVGTRLWPSCVIGRRSYRNAQALFNEAVWRGVLVGTILATTDGFDHYERVVWQILGVACVYGQVIKKRRNNRVIQVVRRLKIGTESHLAEALVESEDSEQLNTSFVERLNLTIRQASAYLRRRSPCHARREDLLEQQVALVQCHYNFCRPHLALKFGRVCRTPAMQAGLTHRRLSFRDIFAPDDDILVRVFFAVVTFAIYAAFRQ